MTLVLCQLLYMNYLTETSQQPYEIDTVINWLAVKIFSKVTFLVRESGYTKTHYALFKNSYSNLNHEIIFHYHSISQALGFPLGLMV